MEAAKAEVQEEGESGDEETSTTAGGHSRAKGRGIPQVDGPGYDSDDREDDNSEDENGAEEDEDDDRSSDDSDLDSLDELGSSDDEQDGMYGDVNQDVPNMILCHYQGVKRRGDRQRATLVGGTMNITGIDFVWSRAYANFD